MSCVITYKGQKYSEEQFKEYFINNKQEFATSIAKNKDVMDSFKRKMEGIDYVFSQSPELASIGSKAQYLQYLSTIFKNSKVKEIVYHGTLPENRFEKFDKQKGTNLSGEYGGIHFGDLTAAIERPTKIVRIENFLAGDEEDLSNFKPNIIPVILNVSNIKRVEEGKNWGQGDWSKLISKEKEANAFVYDNKIENKGNDSYVVFEPDQIHILGSKQDIEGFKEFVKGQTKTSPFKNGKLQVGKFSITEEEFNSMSKDEQDNLLKCL